MNILTLHRPWWQRAAEAARTAFNDWRERRALDRAVEAALELDEGTLRDMGAPLWLVEKARHRREQARFDRSLQHLQRDAGATRFL